jgi:hypothetical protein
MVIAVHVNSSQPHQVEHGQWLKKGIERHGLKVEVTESPTLPADIHIVSGPHYAKKFWLGHPRTVLLDCAYYHDEKSGRWKSTDWVSLGWLREDGGRRFRKGSGRKPPEIEECRGRGTIFLADYGGPIERADTVRKHPAEETPKEALLDSLRRHRLAIGYGTSALVTAALCGLDTICRDSRSILWESDWLELLPYADWRWSEIENGEAWEHLKGSLNVREDQSC